MTQQEIDGTLRAIDQAFESRVGLLFTRLCDGLAGESKPDVAIERFDRGLETALRARAMVRSSAIVKIDGQGT